MSTIAEPGQWWTNPGRTAYHADASDRVVAPSGGDPLKGVAHTPGHDDGRVPRSAEVAVNSRQLLTAARCLAAADPTVCNGIAAERPGYLHEDGRYVVLVVGIITSETYRISADGDIVVPQPGGPAGSAVRPDAQGRTAI